MSGYTLPRSERLRSLSAIRRLFTEGRSGFVYPFRYMVLVEDVELPMDADNPAVGNDEKSVEVMFSVPKKFHKRANKRNLLKRRMREAYRLNKSMLHDWSAGKSIDLALVYSTKDILSYKTVEHAVRRILGQISEHL